MKLVPILAAFGVSIAGLGFAPSAAAQQDGVALAIVYDTSGSQGETVRDKSGKQSPKYVIANRALVSVARQIEAFATNRAAAPRKVECGLFTFQGDRAREAVNGECRKDQSPRDVGSGLASSFIGSLRNFVFGKRNVQLDYPSREALGSARQIFVFILHSSF